MSGASAPSPTRAKPPASAKLEVKTPVLDGFELRQRGGVHRVEQAARLARGPDAVGAGVVAEVLADRRLVEHGPRLRAAPGARPGPTPESISSCGEL